AGNRKAAGGQVAAGAGAVAGGGNKAARNGGRGGARGGEQVAGQFGGKKGQAGGRTAGCARGAVSRGGKGIAKQGGQRQFAGGEGGGEGRKEGPGPRGQVTVLSPFGRAGLPPLLPPSRSGGKPCPDSRIIRAFSRPGAGRAWWPRRSFAPARSWSPRPPRRRR